MLKRAWIGFILFYFLNLAFNYESQLHFADAASSLVNERTDHGQPASVCAGGGGERC